MTELHDHYPSYAFDEHKGYVTPEHQAALREHGPCPEHRFSYVNVRGALIRENASDVGTEEWECTG
jgi:ribonuclease HII